MLHRLVFITANSCHLLGAEKRKTCNCSVSLLFLCNFCGFFYFFSASFWKCLWHVSVFIESLQRDATPVCKSRDQTSWKPAYAWTRAASRRDMSWRSFSMCAKAQRLFLLSVARVLRALSRINIHRCLFLLRASFSGGFVSNLRRMSQSSSPLQRMVDSPFSHKELYGTSHPLEARKKGKRRRVRRSSSTSCRKSSTLSDSSKAKKRAARKGKLDEVDSTTTYRVARKTTSVILPRVDYDSPKVKDKKLPALASRSEMNPSIAASTSRSSPHVSGLASCNGKRFPSDNHLPFRFNPLQGCTCCQVDKLSRNARLTRGLSTTTLPSGSGKPLPVARRWWVQRDFSQKQGVHSHLLTVEDLARGLAKGQYQKIVVMSGAGISTSSGIPDFRYVRLGDESMTSVSEGSIGVENKMCRTYRLQP